MNYLAHLYLSDGEPDLTIGNFIADDITLRELKLLPAHIYRGVELHRLIDAFTDSHELVRRGIKRLRPSQGRYAGVALDILYDYLLAKNWNRYAGISLEDFSEQMYSLFELRKHDIPIRIRPQVARMVEKKFINSYTSREGLIFVMEKVDNRTRFASNFVDSVDVFFNDIELFEQEFEVFFDALQNECTRFTKEAFQ